jgi:CxxC motif-containing protein (DUF1111 family)
MRQHSRSRDAAFPPYPLSLMIIAMCSITACDRAEAPSSPRPQAAETEVRGPAPGGPLPGLTAEQLRLFERGSIVFQVEFAPGTGLGPLFNAAGCANCHESPVVGGGGEAEEEEGGIPGEDIEVFGTAFSGGVCDALAAVGGPVFQKQVTDALAAALGIDHEAPAAAATIGERNTSDLFGFGLLDAVPERSIAALADPADRDGDGVSGRVHRMADGRIGRFGRKAQLPSLDEFNADAFVNESGVTNPAVMLEQFPGGAPGTPYPAGVDPTPEPELSQADLDATNAFVRFLAPPPRLALDNTATRGQELFGRIGCATCHVPSLTTGPNSVAALSNQVVFAYTDLLLHDMGPGLADLCLGDASPSEFRTEPLMGLRFAATFLHDGRAETVEDAILAHGGEARRARDRFAGLPRADRHALLRFLGTL